MGLLPDADLPSGATSETCCSPLRSRNVIMLPVLPELPEITNRSLLRQTWRTALGKAAQKRFSNRKIDRQRWCERANPLAAILSVESWLAQTAQSCLAAKCRTTPPIGQWHRSPGSLRPAAGKSTRSPLPTRFAAIRFKIDRWRGRGNRLANQIRPMCESPSKFWSRFWKIQIDSRRLTTTRLLRCATI